jgi:hypothetical protein
MDPTEAPSASQRTELNLHGELSLQPLLYRMLTDAQLDMQLAPPVFTQYSLSGVRSGRAGCDRLLSGASSLLRNRMCLVRGRAPRGQANAENETKEKYAQTLYRVSSAQVRMCRRGSARPSQKNRIRIPTHTCNCPKHYLLSSDD